VKRLIFGMFLLAALAAALHPLYASEPPMAPFATCNKGKCWIAEKDYKTYRAWHFALIDRMRELQIQNGDLAKEVDTLEKRLISNAFCERHRD
jgi:hypothetical protein